MSVINTMLKDLEQRGGKRDLSKEEILQGLSASTGGMVRRGGSNPYLVSLFSVLAVCALLTLAYLYSPYQLVTVQADEQPQPVALTAQAHTEAAVAVTTVPTKLVAENAADDIVVAAQAPADTGTETREVRQPVIAAPEPSTVQAPEHNDGPSRTRDAALKIATPAQHDNSGPVEKLQPVPPAKTDTAMRTETVAQARDGQPASSAQDDVSEASISKTQREPTSTEKSENAYALAMTLFNQGRTDESRLQLKQALGLDPSNSKAGQLLAAIHLGDNRPELAVDVLDNVLKLRPADQNLLRLYLQVQVQMKNYAQAITLMERRIHVGTPEDIAYLAGLYQKNNDHLGAARLYAQALKLKPSNGIWWMGQGISFEALGRNEQAIKSYQQSISSGRLNTQLAEYVLGRIASIEKSVRDSVS